MRGVEAQSGVGTPEKSPVSFVCSRRILETQFHSAFGLESLPRFASIDT